MSATILAMSAVIAVLVLTVWYLLLERSDLRRDLSWSREEAERWKSEAVKRGWKNPFDESLDALREGVSKLQAAAAAMKRATETQQRNAVKLKEINGAMRATNAGLERQNAALSQAAGRFSRAAAAIRPREAAPASRPPEGSPLVRAALDRIEADLAAGRIENDPKKLN